MAAATAAAATAAAATAGTSATAPVVDDGTIEMRSIAIYPRVKFAPALAESGFVDMAGAEAAPILVSVVVGVFAFPLADGTMIGVSLHYTRAVNPREDQDVHRRLFMSGARSELMRSARVVAAGRPTPRSITLPDALN
jgi:hypothetical protein